MPRMRTVQVPITARYIAAFVLLSFLCYGAHELTHHLAARVACGDWGSMTFSTFQLAQGCEPRGTVLLATLAGPLVTYLFMYGGVLLMMRGRVLPGFTLVLANLPLARFVTVLVRGGDEMVLGRAWIGGDAAWPVMMGVTVALLALPVAYAYRAMANRRRKALFAALLVLPLFADLLLKRVLLSRVLEAWPIAHRGVPVLFVVAMGVAAALLAVLTRGPARLRSQS